MRKADKLPNQANMRLQHAPERPRYVPYISLTQFMRAQTREEWLMYLPVFERKLLD